ncbi:MAG: cell wall hydrolase [Allosphingosinicella sp.]
MAALFLAAVTAWSGPLQAGESATSTVTSSYLDHADAGMDLADTLLGAEPEAPSDPPALTANAVDLSPAHLAAFGESLAALVDSVLGDPRRLDELLTAYAGVATENSEQDCLANAVYFEARGEPIEGQLAVAEVVLNRARSGRYPPTICQVVTQPWQFSFVRHGVIPRADRGSEAWRRAVGIARIAEAGASRLLPREVLWYHAEYVSPSWGRRLARNTKIGLHIFYS